MGNIKIYSSIGLEPWKWDNPDLFGIGGSETSHIEMALRLNKRGHQITSYCPIEAKDEGVYDGIYWTHPDESWEESESPEGIWIVYRDPKFFDRYKPEGAKWWFIAQDCDYDWTPERLEKVDRYWCLCPTHAEFTCKKYPQIASKVYVTSNGIKTDKIRPIVEKPRTYNDRNPLKIVYTSSPDRGLQFILENWFRVRERMPWAECHIFYGFENIEKLIAMNPNDPLAALQNNLKNLLNQEGIIWRGRVSQPQLWQEYATANAWWYPTDWPETSCISCMEAQALGAIPITSDYWALRDNVQWGAKTAGPPQKNNIDKILTIDYLEAAMRKPREFRREEMQQWALETFDWENFVTQWEKFIEADLG